MTQAATGADNDKTPAARRLSGRRRQHSSTLPMPSATIRAALGFVAVALAFSALLAIFRHKFQGYPYRFLL